MGWSQASVAQFYQENELRDPHHSLLFHEDTKHVRQKAVNCDDDDSAVLRDLARMHADAFWEDSKPEVRHQHKTAWRHARTFAL